MSPSVTDAAHTTLPPPGEIRRAVEEVLSRPQYADTPSIAEGMFQDWLASLGEWIENVFEPFFSSLENTVDFTTSLREDSPILFWGAVTLLSLIFFVAVSRLGYRLYAAVRARRLDRGLPDRLLTAAIVTPEALEAEAEAAGSAGDWSLALRLLFKAGVMRLEQASDGFYKPALTNAEYVRRFARTEAEEPLAFLARTVNRWYAGEPCGQDLYVEGVRAHERLVALAGERG